MATIGQERVGPYRLINLIRKGAVCDIWEVDRLGQDERWAMKLISNSSKQTKEQIAELRREFQIGQPLRHPNVIQTIDFGTGPDGTWLLLELMRAPNLKQRIQLGVDRLQYQAEQIIRGAAAALGYLHDQGWVHRDIKPDNYLVDDTGYVKMIDFNLAQRRKGLLGKMLSFGSKVQGTQSYMSPEQIRGQVVDERSDIYSFGCMVHELIAGKPPFTGTSTNELLNKHLKSRPPSLDSLCDNVGAQFPKLIQRTLAKDPRQRPASMSEFLSELDEIKIFRNKPKPPSPEN